MNMHLGILRALWIGVLALPTLAASQVGPRNFALPNQRLEFVENLGQWETDARFVARGATAEGVPFLYGLDAGGLFLKYSQQEPRTENRSAVASHEFTGSLADEPTAWLEEMERERQRPGAHSVVFRLEFLGGDPNARIVGTDFGQSLYHYRLGNDKQRWQIGLQGAQQVRVEDVWPGINVVLREGADGLEYDVEVDAGVELGTARFRLVGPEGELDLDHGALRLETEWGALSQSAPVSFVGTSSGDANQLDPTASSFDLQGQGVFGFRAPERALDQRLVIDPGVSWATYIGGKTTDFVYDVAYVDADHVVFCGSTDSITFPVTPGYFPWADEREFREGYVAKLDIKNMSLDYSLFVGGDGDDTVGRIGHHKPTGDIFLNCNTDSTDFPTTPGAVQPNPVGVFCYMRLSGDATQLHYSTFWGGEGAMLGGGNGYMMSDGGLVVIGSIKVQFHEYIVSPGAMLPLPAFEYQQGGTSKTLWAAKLARDGKSILWSTFISGPTFYVEEAPDGAIVMAAFTDTKGLMTTPGSYQSTLPPGEVFASYLHRMRGDGTSLVGATYFGTDEDSIYLRDISVGPDGSVYLGGNTRSVNFPATAGTLSTVLGDGGDGYLARLSPDLKSLDAATLVGSALTNSDEINLIHVGQSGVITAAFTSHGGTFKVTPGSHPPPSPLTSSHQYLLRIQPDLSEVLFSTYITIGSDAGTDYKWAKELAVGNHGDALIVGDTHSMDMVTSPGSLHGVPQGSHASGFLKALDMLPRGVWKYGDSTSPCSDSISMGVTNTPISGSADFSIWVSGAVPTAKSFLLVGTGQDEAGTPLQDISAHVDLAQSVWVLPVPSPDASGYQEFPVAIPPGLAGLDLYCQAVYFDRGPCHPIEGWSSSNALHLKVQ